MTDQQHLITPPPELVQQWWEKADQYQDDPKTYFDHVATEAARWGSDQELEACITWVAIESLEAAKELRAARRPKPPSLKERALQAWAAVEAGTDDQTAMAVIRRALEQLYD